MPDWSRGTLDELRARDVLAGTLASCFRFLFLRLKDRARLVF